MKRQNKMFSKNRFRKCFDKNKKVKTKNKMATKTFSMNKTVNDPATKIRVHKNVSPKLFRTQNCKTENLATKTVASKMFRNKMQTVTEMCKNAKMAKMAKPGRGGRVPVPYQRLINCKKGHFWNFGHFSRA